MAAPADGTHTMAVVPSPPADPPIAGLIPSLGPPGGTYLDPPDTFDGWNWPAFNPWAEPSGVWTAEAVVAAGGNASGLMVPARFTVRGAEVEASSLLDLLDGDADRLLAAAIMNRVVDGGDPKAVFDAAADIMGGRRESLRDAVLAGAYNPPTLAFPGYGGGRLVDRDGPVRPDDPRTGVGPRRARWEDGFQYLPEQTCQAATAQDPCSPDLTHVPAQPSTVKEMPFLVWAGDQCSSFGWEAHDYRGRAIRALLASESKQIAAEQWAGAAAKAAGWPNAVLASVPTDTLTATAVDTPTALDLLEQAIAYRSNGQRGAIYCTPQLASFWSGLGGTLRTVNGVILTYRGTVIIADAGYDGTGPNGEPVINGSQWAYATLMPTVRRGEVQVEPDTLGEALDRTQNTITWRAWRLAAVTWPPCVQVAVNVSLPMPLFGGVS